MLDRLRHAVLIWHRESWLSRSEAGATATEYAVLMGFIALVVVIGIGAFGLSVNGWYEGLATGVEAVLP